MAKAILIDTTVCTACRGCQVACKQWHNLPAEKTINMGGYQNPRDLSFDTYKLVRMTEEIIDGHLQWLFFPDQCRHCVDAPCLETAMDEEAIYKDAATGAVMFTRHTRRLDPDEIIYSCPYDIPRKAEDGTLAKCDLCNDRVKNGLKPACVTACPTGAMQFAGRDTILALAKDRLKTVRSKFPKAMLLNPDTVNVIYLVAFDPGLYAEYAVADAGRSGISRKVALQKMLSPFARMMQVKV